MSKRTAFYLGWCVMLVLIVAFETMSYPRVLGRIGLTNEPAPAWLNVVVVDSMAIFFWGLFLVIGRVPVSVPRWWTRTIQVGCAVVVFLILSINFRNWK